ncbi:hypothetical protein ACQPYE_16995 [Actinosynnema sp. CA-299493]
MAGVAQDAGVVVDADEQGAVEDDRSTCHEVGQNAYLGVVLDEGQAVAAEQAHVVPAA